jgi:hypothetical protein
LDETFTSTEDRFGEIVEVELKPGGANIPVTEDNKKEYVEAVVEYRTKTRVREQSQAFMHGFHEIIPQDLIELFDERELELLIGGMSEIDTWVSLHAHLYHVNNALQAMTGSSTLITADTKRRTKSSSGSGNASVVGRQNASRAYSSLRRVLPGYLLMASRIYKVQMGPGDSPSTSLVIHRSFRGVIRVSTGSNCLLTKITRASRKN